MCVELRALSAFPPSCHGRGRGALAWLLPAARERPVHTKLMYRVPRPCARALNHSANRHSAVRKRDW